MRYTWTTAAAASARPTAGKAVPAAPPQAAYATTATASGVTLTQAQVYINSVLKCTFDIIYT